MMLSCTCTHSLGSLLEQEGEGWEDHPRESEGPDSESEGRVARQAQHFGGVVR